MKLLTIDTSSTTCSVALTSDGRLLAEYLLSLEKTLSERLLKSIGSIMRDAGLSVADLDGIGVALGPGSFTGLRVGVATAKGLAMASNKPLVGFSSLAMLAMNLPWAVHQVCPMLDARKKETYAALYRCTDLPEALFPDCVIDPAAFLENVIEPTLFLGEGALRYRKLIEDRLGGNAIFAPPVSHVPRASAGAILTTAAFMKGEALPLTSINPVYIRASEAELLKSGR